METRIADSAERNWLSVAEVARSLGVSRTTVWRWIRAGHLPAHRIGLRTLRVERDAVDGLGELLRSRRATPEERATAFTALAADPASAHVDEPDTGPRALRSRRATP